MVIAVGIEWVIRWLEANGRLWFCGRKVERVLTNDGHSIRIVVKRFLISTQGSIVRLIDVAGGMPESLLNPKRGDAIKRGRASFIADLRELGKNNRHTAKIEHFYFEKAFPVDVRHNAKIHRLSLARKYRMP